MHYRHRPSPNFGRRRAAIKPDMLIFHYTGMRSTQEALYRLCDPASQVSAHYLIDEDGTCFKLVDEDARAWHAGRAFWEGDTDINSRSIGIELVNPGHEFGYRPFPKAQIAALKILATDIIRRHRISPSHVLGHADVAPLRKQDPGELFPWQGLAREGIGLWPDTSSDRHAVRALRLAPGACGPKVFSLQRLLRDVGYGVPQHGLYDMDTAQVICAAQRHWQPERVNGIADAILISRLEKIVRYKR